MTDKAEFNVATGILTIEPLTVAEEAQAVTDTAAEAAERVKAKNELLDETIANTPVLKALFDEMESVNPGFTDKVKARTRL